MKEILVMLNEMSDEEFNNLVRNLTPKYSPPIEKYDIQSVNEHSACVYERE